MVNGVVKQITTFAKSSSLQFLKNLKLNRPINIEYQHKSKSVTKGYALFAHMDHKYALYSIFDV